MSEEGRTTLEKGLRGTDNCPICGRAMTAVTPLLLAASGLVRFICISDDHEVTITLKHPGAERRAEGE